MASSAKMLSDLADIHVPFRPQADPCRPVGGFSEKNRDLRAMHAFDVVDNPLRLFIVSGAISKILPCQYGPDKASLTVQPKGSQCATHQFGRRK